MRAKTQQKTEPEQRQERAKTVQNMSKYKAQNILKC